MRVIAAILFAKVLLIGNLSAQTISEIQGQGDASPFEGETVTTSGIVTASFTTGSNSTSAYFIQDGNGPRSGIYVYDGNFSPSVGDEVEITATVDEFFGLTELVDVTSLNIQSSGNTLPEPLVVTTGEANSEDYESMLLTIESAACSNPDIGFGEFELNDGSGALAVDDLIFAFTASEGINYTVTAPLYYSFEAFKLVPRVEEDIQIADELFFTSFPAITEITANSLQVSWQTNVASTAELEYGETDGYELGSILDEAPSTAHSITIDNLEPGTIYYFNATAQNESTSIDNDLVAVTASESSGTIKVFFNHIVDVSYADEEEAQWTPMIRDTIISFIDSAKHSIDVTMYDVENEAIIEALNEARDRGVEIRYISDEGTENPVLENLDPDIPLLLGNPDGLMHNKFFVFDREVTDSCWVMTGSTNHTEANLGWDFNNLICIQDQSLARAYTLEFEEMWGSSSLEPNTELAKFGTEKTDNTPHLLLIDGIETELYFSPSDGVSNKIEATLESAEESIEFATLIFTENALGDAIVAAHDQGLQVRGIIDYVESSGSEFDYLVDQGVDVMDYQNADGSQWPDGPTLHHKYAIIDRESDTRAKLITGSHNWTASANSIHDENTLIFHSQRLANLYYQEFMARFQGWFTGVADLEIISIGVYPNPTTDLLRFDIPKGENFNRFRIFDLKGAVVSEGIFRSGQPVDVSDLEPGVYVITLLRKSRVATAKFVVD